MRSNRRVKNWSKNKGRVRVLCWYLLNSQLGNQQQTGQSAAQTPGQIWSRALEMFAPRSSWSPSSLLPWLSVSLAPGYNHFTTFSSLISSSPVWGDCLSLGVGSGVCYCPLFRPRLTELQTLSTTQQRLSWPDTCQTYRWFCCQGTPGELSA